MNRNARRKAEREHTVYSKAVNKLTPLQTQLIDKLALQKADTMVFNISKIINDCYFKAMRENRVGKERADRILARTEELIDLAARK